MLQKESIPKSANIIFFFFFSLFTTLKKIQHNLRPSTFYSWDIFFARQVEGGYPPLRPGFSKRGVSILLSPSLASNLFPWGSLAPALF